MKEYEEKTADHWKINMDMDYVVADLMTTLADDKESDVVNIPKIFESINADYDSVATMKLIRMRGEKVFHGFDDCDVFKGDETVLNDWILLN